MNLRKDGGTTCVACGSPAFVGISGHPSMYCSEKCRKLKYARKCVNCGAVCNTDGRVAQASVRCMACAIDQTKTLEWAKAASTRSRARGFVWSDEELIAALHSAARELGDPLSASKYKAVYQDRDWPSPATLNWRLGGTWKAACERAGLTVLNAEYQTGKHRDACLDDFLFVAERLGHAPTEREYAAWRRTHSHLGLISVAHMRRRLGGWVAARQLADLHLQKTELKEAA